jgi:PhnB protein
MKKNSYIAEGYNAVTPSLAFKGTSEAIEWYKSVFGANEKMRMEGPDKKVMHAELTIGDSIIFLAEEDPQYNNKSPKTLGGNSMKLYVYTPDVDATIKKARENRAKVIKPAEDQFYGDRCGLIEDPFGYEWSIATHVREVSEKEMKKAMEEMAHQHA